MALSGLPQKWLINYRVGLKQTEKKKKEKRLRTRFITFWAFSVWEIIYLFVSRWPFTMSNFCILYISCPPCHKNLHRSRSRFSYRERQKKKQKEKKIHLENEIITAFSLGDLSQRGVLVKTTKKNFSTKNWKSNVTRFKRKNAGGWVFLFICSTRRILTH